MKLNTQQVRHFIVSDEKFIKDARVIVYLLISGLLGYLLAQIADNDMLTVILAPAINYALYKLAQRVEENKE